MRFRLVKEDAPMHARRLAIALFLLVAVTARVPGQAPKYTRAEYEADRKLLEDVKDALLAKMVKPAKLTKWLLPPPLSPALLRPPPAS